MKFSTFKKSTIRILLILVILGLSSMAWVEYQLRKVRGTYVELVDSNQFIKPQSKLLVKNVAVLSEDGTIMIDSQNVFINQGRIEKITKELSSTADYAVIDGSGKYLIPGLVDSHVHLRNSKNDLLLYLANGVTYVREMSGNKTHIQWRKEKKETIVGPRLFITSEKVYNDGGLKGMFTSWTRTRINLDDPNKAIDLAKRLKDEGYDGIKISNFLNREMYTALAQASSDEGIPLVGHIPNDISLTDFWDYNQQEIAHIEELTKALNREFGGYTSTNSGEFIQYVQRRSHGIAKKLIEHDIAVTSSIWLMESLPEQKFNLKAALKLVPLEYVNPASLEGTPLTKGWLPGHNSYELNAETINNRDAKRRSQIFWDTYVSAIRIMTRTLAQYNVKILAGTDAETPITVPGFSLHDELVSLNNSGLSTAQTLQTATSLPGVWMQTNTGKIAKGYDADLVLLNKNPLENIANTKSIASVIHEGRHINRATLDQMLQEVKNHNNNERTQSIDEFLNE